MLQRETRCQMILSSSWSFKVDSRNVVVFLYSSMQALVEDFVVYVDVILL